MTTTARPRRCVHARIDRRTAITSLRAPSGEWVAVVDDDASVRTALARLLRSAGIAVETFASAQEYLAIVGERRPGCLVLDVHLGAMTGFELHERLVSTASDVPTVFITAHDEISSGELARRVGPDGFLRKPFDSDEFLTVVNRRLRERDSAPEE